MKKMFIAVLMITLLFLVPAATPTWGAVAIGSGVPLITVGKLGTPTQLDAAETTLNSLTTTVGFGGKLWKVIGYKQDSGGYDGVLNDGGGALPVADSYMTLLLANVSGNDYDKSVFKTSPPGNNVYAGSALKGAMETAYGTLPSAEQGLVLSRDLATGTYNSTLANWCDGVETSPVSGAEFWPLSTREASYVPTSIRKFDYYHWWLRSPGGITDGAADVYDNGNVNHDGSYINHSLAIRPAFNLNLSSVIFTSAASGASGKNSVTVGGGLSTTSAPTGAVKFTVSHSSQKLDVLATTAQSTQSGSTLAFGYRNAATGSNQFVSCTLEEGSSVKYYGKLADSSGAVSGDLSVPLVAVANGTYTLSIFSEQANGDNLTDLASAPVTMTLTVSNATGTAVGTVSNFGGTIVNPGIGGGGRGGGGGGCDAGAVTFVALALLAGLFLHNRRP